MAADVTLTITPDVDGKPATELQVSIVKRGTVPWIKGPLKVEVVDGFIDPVTGLWVYQEGLGRRK